MSTRRRRLGGTPAEHSEKIGTTASSALRQMKTATTLASKGQCRAAFRAFVGGSQTLELALEHDRSGATGAYLGTELETVLEARSGLERDFMQKCLVGGGLSGMRRRRAGKR